jgi:hypothetical protein
VTALAKAETVEHWSLRKIASYVGVSVNVVLRVQALGWIPRANLTRLDAVLTRVGVALLDAPAPHGAPRKGVDPAVKARNDRAIELCRELGRGQSPVGEEVTLVVTRESVDLVLNAIDLVVFVGRATDATLILPVGRWLREMLHGQGRP